MPSIQSEKVKALALTVAFNAFKDSGRFIVIVAIPDWASMSARIDVNPSRIEDQASAASALVDIFRFFLNVKIGSSESVGFNLCIQDAFKNGMSKVLAVL